MNLIKTHTAKRGFIAVIFVIFTIHLADARPARPLVRTVTQPDGSSFTLITYGDEFHKVCRTRDGHAVIRDKDGWWCYEVVGADGIRCSSGCPAGSRAPADILSESLMLARTGAVEKRRIFDNLQAGGESVMKSLRESARTKAEGTVISKHGIVLLAAFKDVAFKYTREDFQRMLTEPGYSVGGGTGSAREYFETQFGEGYEFGFDVSDIVTLSRNRSYYGGNDKEGSDKAPAEMVAEACELAKDMVDFSLYDQNGDGEVDNVFVIFAGEDEADTSNEDCIWAHAWYVRSGAGMDILIDGVYINRYACASELMPASGNTMTLTGIGTFCHEYSHTLGLYDTYDTDYEQSGGVSGALWCYTALMDGGNLNNNGNTPPYFNAFEREVMGICEPVVISANGTYTMSPVSRGGNAFRIDTDDPDEYYLLECRKAEGWDKYIGGSGMLVYHIDKSSVRTIWSDTFSKEISPYYRWTFYNEINAAPDHQCADMIEADGRSDRFSDFSAYGKALYVKGLSGLFYPTSTVNSIPSTRLKYWSGAENTVAISEITKDGNGDVSFYVSGLQGSVPPIAVIGDRTVFQDAVIIRFTSDIEGTVAEATVVWGETDGEKQSVKVKPYSPGKYAVAIEGLKPSVNYDVTISFTVGQVTGKTVTTSFITSRLQGGSYPYISFKGTERNPDGTFPATAGLPLRVWNATEAAQVKWLFDDKEVSIGADCLFTPSRSGCLKAVIFWEDGTEDIIRKDIIIADTTVSDEK